MNSDSSESHAHVRRIIAGDRSGWEALLARYEPRLRRVIAFRIDPQLQGRLDPDDVLQEVYLVAYQGLPEYRRQPGVSFFLWLRGIANNKLLELHRHHLGVPMRDARREVSLYRGPSPEATSAALAARLLGRLTRPSEAAIRSEAKVRLQEALNAIDPIDREVLALRHFEHLTNAESAAVLGIKETAAGKRYLRALERLREVLTQCPGGLEL
jgi:RNA polymerase sigma-70 factor (ECF subfamily)